jgi:hypothetical protein
VQVTEAAIEGDLRLSDRRIGEDGQLVCPFHFEAPC